MNYKKNKRLDKFRNQENNAQKIRWKMLEINKKYVAD